MEPYYKRDHRHCPEKDSPCGMKGKHPCCLCGESLPDKGEVPEMVSHDDNALFVVGNCQGTYMMPPEQEEWENLSPAEYKIQMLKEMKEALQNNIPIAVNSEFPKFMAAFEKMIDGYASQAKSQGAREEREKCENKECPGYKKGYNDGWMIEKEQHQRDIPLLGQYRTVPMHSDILPSARMVEQYTRLFGICFWQPVFEATNEAEAKEYIENQASVKNYVINSHS